MTAAELEAAAARAWETLREHLSPTQRATFDVRGEFVATTSRRSYSIACGPNSVVVRFGNPADPIRSGYSAWTATVKGRNGQLPVGDLALVAKLSIENAEAHWLEMALMCGSVWVEDRSDAQLAQEREQREALYQAMQQAAGYVRGAQVQQQQQPAQQPGPGGFDPVAVGGIHFIR